MTVRAVKWDSSVLATEAGLHRDELVEVMNAHGFGVRASGRSSLYSPLYGVMSQRKARQELQKHECRSDCAEYYAKRAYELGEHLHTWADASPFLRDRYMQVIRDASPRGAA